MRTITASFPVPLVKALGNGSAVRGFYIDFLRPLGISNNSEFVRVNAAQARKSLNERDPYLVIIGVSGSSVAIGFYDDAKSKIICYSYSSLGATNVLPRSELYTADTLYLVRSSEEAADALSKLRFNRQVSQPSLLLKRTNLNNANDPEAFERFDKSGYAKRRQIGDQNKLRAIVYKNLKARIDRQLNEAKESMLSITNAANTKQLSSKLCDDFYTASKGFYEIIDRVNRLNLSYFSKGMYDPARPFEELTSADQSAITISMNLQHVVDSLKKLA